MVRHVRHVVPSLLLALTALLAAGCGGDGGEGAAAVSVDSGSFGALMVGSGGERLMPLVTRDVEGRATAVTGALWMDREGSTLAVFLDAATGRPDKAVFGDFELVFANWSADGTRADVARIYAPTGYVEVYRSVAMTGEGTGEEPGRVASSATCLPDCPTRLQTLSEVLKLAGVGVSAVGCYAAAGISFGAMLIPCTGYLVGAAKVLVGDEAMLGDLEHVNKYLTGIDIAMCTTGMDASSCVQAALEGATKVLDHATAVIAGNAAAEETARQALADAAFGAGVVQGIPPGCDKVYRCTPGLTLNCIEGGTKTCQDDCTWGDCPPPPEHISGGQCYSTGGMCECGVQESCVKASGTSMKCWYHTDRGDFVCSSCQTCEGAAQAAIAACCPKRD